jgi:hypothetical protein
MEINLEILIKWKEIRNKKEKVREEFLNNLTFDELKSIRFYEEIRTDIAYEIYKMNNLEI